MKRIIFYLPALFLIFAMFLCSKISLCMANETALNTQTYKSRIESYYTDVNAIPEINEQCQEMLEKPFNTDIFASQNNIDVGFDCYVHTFVQKLNDEQFEIFEQLGDDIRITLDDLSADKNMKISDFKANLKFARLNMIIFFYNIIYQKNNLFLPLKTGNYLMEHCYGITQCMKQEIYEMVVENTMTVNRSDVEHSLNKLLNDTEEFFTKSGLTNHRLYDALRKVYNLYWDIFYTTSNITQ